MLIDAQVYGFREVNDQSFEDIKITCLAHFASNLREALTSKQERIRKWWVDSATSYDGNHINKGSIANYKMFADFFSTHIKYNTKSIVFEETITNDPNAFYSVKGHCASFFGLEYIPATEEHSGYYRYRKDGIRQRCDNVCECFVGEKVPDEEERLRHFDEAFGKGEFPFLTIIIIRLGNKDHYFYTVHR